MNRSTVVATDVLKIDLREENYVTLLPAKFAFFWLFIIGCQLLEERFEKELESAVPCDIMAKIEGKGETKEINPFKTIRV